eukprot:12885861-Prorocentrum_lima.AAC.1
MPDVTGLNIPAVHSEVLYEFAARFLGAQFSTWRINSPTALCREGPHITQGRFQAHHSRAGPVVTWHRRSDGD